MKKIRGLLPYLGVLLCLLLGIAVSQPSQREPHVVQGWVNEMYRTVGDEPQVYRGMDTVVVARVLRVKTRCFQGGQIGSAARYICETVSTIRIEEVLMQNDAARTYEKGDVLYVMENGTERAPRPARYFYGDYLQKGDRMVLFLENVNDRVRSMYNRNYTAGLGGYTIMRRSESGRMDRMISPDGTLTAADLAPYGRERAEDPPFSAYTTLTELREVLKTEPKYELPPEVADDTEEERQAFLQAYGEAAYLQWYYDPGYHVLRAYLSRQPEAK